MMLRNGWKKKKELNDHAIFDVLGFMTECLKDIVRAVEYREDVLKAKEHLVEMITHRAENICTWRDKQFKSIYTGKLAPAPKIPWMNNFDVTLEEFLNQCSE